MQGGLLTNPFGPTDREIPICSYTGGLMSRGHSSRSFGYQVVGTAILSTFDEAI